MIYVVFRPPPDYEPIKIIYSFNEDYAWNFRASENILMEWTSNIPCIGYDINRKKIFSHIQLL